MSSIIQTFQKSQSLPVSQADPKDQQQGLRRRLSSLSLKIQPSISNSRAASWAFHRSKSLSSMGQYAGGFIRKWWDWGWSWILSRKPMFAKDLEMNEEETRVLGSHNKGSWRHVFYKARFEVRRLIGSDNITLPQTYKQYNSFDYSKNFDDGKRRHSVM